MDERIYKIALNILNGIGPKRAKQLVANIGSVEGVFKEKKEKLGRIEGIGSFLIRSLNRKEALIRAEKELNFIADNGIELHYYKDSNYPAQLKFCEDGPVVLFSKGNISFKKPAISVVGTRKATSYGKKIVKDFMHDLVGTDIQVVSGLAHGIDKEAHEQALKNGLSTLAVLGHGLDLIYPAAHKKLAQRMLETGGLVTEFLSKTPGDPSNFPKRNRIVAGLSQATVVIESAKKGGSLITAELANDYNREVFAFPGQVNQPFSAGCNALIQENKAHLICSGQEIIDELNLDFCKTEKFPVQGDLFKSMNTAESKIVSLFTSNEAYHIDYLANAARLEISELSVHLFNLEMKGAISTVPGNRYRIA